MILNGGENIGVSNSRVGLTSYTQLDTGDIKFRPMSGDILLDARDEGRKRKERIYQENTGAKGIPF